MKQKFLSILLSGCILLVLCGCGSIVPQGEQKQTVGVTDATEQETEASIMEVQVGCMKGPTAIGMIQLLAASDAGETRNHYAYTIAGTADELSTALVKGELDLAAVPCNLASVLYNKTEGQVLTVAINTLGVLYLVEAGDSVETVTDLKGKTIYSTGQGTTPEYTLRFLLTSAGLNPDKDVDIQYKSEAPEVLAALNQKPEAIAMLPQPYTTVALNSNEAYRIALDVTKEWEKLTEGTVVTGVLVARKEFIESYPKAFADFLKEYEVSADYASEQVEATAGLLEQYDVFKAAIAKKAIPYCNVTFIKGEDMKRKAMGYLQVLYEQNPKAVGGKLEEGMFYIEE